MAENPDRIKVSVDVDTAKARRALAEIMRLISEVASNAADEMRRITDLAQRMANELDGAADRGDPDAQS